MQFWHILEVIVPVCILAYGLVTIRGTKNYSLISRLNGKNNRKTNFICNITEEFPFLLTLILIGIMFGIYEFTRACVALFYEDIRTVALQNAQTIQYLQQWMGLKSIEYNVQQYSLRHPLFIVFCNHFYKQLHWSTTAFVIVFLFKKTSRMFFLKFALWFILCNLIAFIVFFWFPTAPPRLCEDIGIVDTVKESGSYSHGVVDNPLMNHYAAVPSMHFGYAVMFFYIFLRVYERKIDRGQGYWIVIAGSVYVLFMCYDIMITGNHFFLDAIFGSVVVFVSHLLMSFIVIPILIKSLHLVDGISNNF